MERWLRMQAQTGAVVPDDMPVALWLEGGHGPVVHAVNRAARLAGIVAGARLTDMRAICPSLRAEPADPMGDAGALDRLALWARRFCPWTAADRSAPGAGLVMDTTGADHLWGGEPAMLEAIEAQLSMLGFHARLALAPSWGAAWGLARFGGVRPIADDDRALMPLPVAALRLSADTLLLLRRLGLKTVADLAAIPRLSLARRFARAALEDNPLLRLDQAMGRLAEPIAPSDPPAAFRAQARLAEPVLDPAQNLPGLCATLCRDLAAEAQGARRLRLTVWRVDGEVRWIDTGTARATRDPAHIAFLFRDRLERIDPGFGFDLIELSAPHVEPLADAQPDLTGEARPGTDLAQLIDRLETRFGSGCVSRPVRRESHVPERAIGSVPAMAPVPPEPDPMPDRPLRIFDPAEEVKVVYAVPEGPPAQFIWRRVQSRVARWQGPERIAPEWWSDRPGTRLRDYYKVEDSDGRRLWLYREGLAGDGRGGVPRWFVHGMFA